MFDLPFCQSISSRVKGGTGRVMNSIFIQETLKLGAGEHGPFSDTNSSVSPCVVNNVLRCSSVDVNVAVLHILISIHLECATTNPRKCDQNGGLNSRHADEHRGVEAIPKAEG